MRVCSSLVGGPKRLSEGYSDAESKNGRREKEKNGSAELKIPVLVVFGSEIAGP